MLLEILEPLRDGITVLRDLIDSEEDRQKQHNAHHDGEQQWSERWGRFPESRSEAHIERPRCNRNDDSPAYRCQKIAGKPESQQS
jgi:hypothetical protein